MTSSTSELITELGRQSTAGLVLMSRDKIMAFIQRHRDTSKLVMVFGRS